MKNLLIFTEEDDKILSLYEEISKENLDNKEYEKLVKKYPALENYHSRLCKSLKRIF